MKLDFYGMMYLIIHLVDIVIVSKMVTVFLGKEIKSKLFCVLSYAFYYLITGFCYIVFDIPFLTLTVNIVTLFIITLNYKSTLTKKIICVICTYVMFGTVETLVCAITDYYGYPILESGSYNSVFGQCLIRVSTYTVVIIISHLKSINSNEKVHFSSWLVTIFIPAATMYLEFNFLTAENPSKVQMCISIIIVLLLNFICLYMYNSLEAFYQRKMNETLLKYELVQMKNQNKIQLNYYKELDKKYKESEKTIHDIKKHLYTLSELSNIDSEKAENYRKIIEKGMDSLVIGFHCTNQILSIIMSQKIAVAENENITVKTDVEDLTLDFISDIDLTAVFANLWDNAIEACMQVDEDKRYIRFQMKQSGGFVVIGVHNPHGNNLDSSKGKYFSTKENHKGVGLSIIKSAVEKYDGLFNIEHDENTFTAEITIPMPVE